MTDGKHPFTRALERLRHDPLEVARAAAAGGARVVGYVGDATPIALILAAGALPVRLRGDTGPLENISDLIEPTFAPELRAVASQWLRGALDFIDAVVFSRADDSAQRLYYYLCELQRRGQCRGPRPLLYDIANIARPSSVEHSLDSTRRLAAELGADAGRLEPAIQRVRKRAELRDAVRSRRALPAPLPGSVAWTFEYAASGDWRDSFDADARRWLDSAPLLPIPARVVLAGDPPPDEQLHVAIEACGASVVGELTGHSQAGDRAQRDALGAIAEQMRQQESPAQSMRRHARWLAEGAQEHRADGVVIWLSEQNEALPWEIPRQMQSLRAAGIPVSLLARQPASVPAAVVMQVMDFARDLGRRR